jgi:hypothetical protein
LTWNLGLASVRQAMLGISCQWRPGIIMSKPKLNKTQSITLIFFVGILLFDLLIRVYSPQSPTLFDIAKVIINLT